MLISNLTVHFIFEFTYYKINNLNITNLNDKFNTLLHNYPQLYNNVLYALIILVVSSFDTISSELSKTCLII